MADLVSLSTLRTKVRQRADMVSSQFCSDSEINGYIQDSYKALYDLLVEAVEDYSLSSTTSTISTGNTFALPSNFYKLRGLDDYTSPANPLTVRRYEFGERNDYSVVDSISAATVFSDVMYRIQGSTVAIVPADRAARTYRLWFVPTPTIPALDADTIDVVNGFDEFIVCDSAIKCLIKEESDISGLVLCKNNELSRIQAMRKNRDQALPEKVTRVRNNRRAMSYPYAGYFDI